MKLSNFFENINTKSNSGVEKLNESGCLGKQIKKGKKKVKEDQSYDDLRVAKYLCYNDNKKFKPYGRQMEYIKKAEDMRENNPKEYQSILSKPSPPSDKSLRSKLNNSVQEDIDLNDNMIGTPDSFYDEEERKEAYEDLKDAMEEFAKGWERESVMNGICPNCAGTGYQDAEYPEYDDDGEEIEGSAFECDGHGMFGCDEGEMVGASWVDIIKHDERKAEREKAKADYPGDEAVIDQIARAVKMLDDPRQMYQYMKADYPFMGVAQRSDLIAKGMKKAGLTEGVLDYLTKGIYLNDPVKQNLQFALATMLGKDMDNSPWYNIKIEVLEKELEQKDKNLFVNYLNKKADKLGGTQGKSPFMKSLESITEGEERSIIHDATVEKLVDEFSDRVGEMESMEELHDKMYAELEYLDVDEVVDPDMEVGGQRIGDFANGRVIDILDSGSVMDEVTNSLDLSDLQDRDSAFPYQYKEGVQEDKELDSNEAMVSKMLAKALGDENRWSEMTPHELYAELESEKPEVADVIKLTAKMLYDVKLAENTKDPESKGDCEPCKGTGYKDGNRKSSKSCPVCDGDGEEPGFGGTKAYEEITLDEDQDFTEEFGILGYSIDEENTFEAEYRGRKVKLNKPIRGDVKKFKVYVKDPKTGNVKKVNFGHGGTSAKRKTMRIRKSNPKARTSFRARHNCDNPGPKTKARFWSCRKW